MSNLFRTGIYPKIHTVFLRDPETRNKTLLMGQYTLPEFEYLANNRWVFTEKVDGTNIRVIIGRSLVKNPTWGSGEPDVDEIVKVKPVITFGGKTNDAQIPMKLCFWLEEKFLGEDMRQRLSEMFPHGACLYGEGYGAGIQAAGKHYRPLQEFVLFDVLVTDADNPDKNWWLERDNVVDVADKLGLDVVPIIGGGTLPGMVLMAREGFKSRWGDFPAEGIVARPATELFTRKGERIITKIKYKDFPRR